MKNLKKVLALVLVVVMALGLITVSNAAFSDEATIEKKEAVDVLTAIGVINGQPDGSFQPEGDVTRAQMAKMIAIIMNEGKDEVNDLYKDACKFTDSASNWAAGYIAYCAQAGIINGKSETTFDPDGKVTGTEAAKMLLCALNYDAKSEGFVGAGWDTAVLAKAADAKLIGSDYNLSVLMSAPLNRENAAQMILNALQADMVKYKNKGIAIVTNEITINTGAETEVVTKDNPSGTTRYDQINGTKKDSKSIVQLGEEKFSKLVKQPDNTDAFGRPAHVWSFDGKEVTRAADTATLTYTDQVKGGELYNALGKVDVSGTFESVSFTLTTATAPTAPTSYARADNNYIVNYYIDGQLVYGPVAGFNEVNAVGGTPLNPDIGDVWTYTMAQGAITIPGFPNPAQYPTIITSADTHDFGRIGDKIEVYKNVDAKTITIVQTNYYTATIANAYATQKNTNGDVTRAGYVTLQDPTYTTQAPAVEDGQFTATNSFATEEFTAADAGARVIYTVGYEEDGNTATTGKQPVIKSVAKAETATGLFTTSTNVRNSADYATVVVGGTTYNVQAGISGKTQNENVTLYLDPNGNVAAMDGEDAGAYAYLIYVNPAVATGISSTPMGRLVFTDGTVKEVKLNALYREDLLYTYRVDSKDVYTLTAPKIADDATTDTTEAANGTGIANNGVTVTLTAGTKKVNYFGGITVNNDTKFIVETYDSGNNEAVYTVYEGVNNLPELSYVDYETATAGVEWTNTSGAYYDNSGSIPYSSVGLVTAPATSPYVATTGVARTNTAGATGSYVQAAAISPKSGHTGTIGAAGASYTADAAKFVYVFGATVRGATSANATALFYTATDSQTTEADNSTYYTVNAIVDGAPTTVKVRSSEHPRFGTNLDKRIDITKTVTTEGDVITGATRLTATDGLAQYYGFEYDTTNNYYTGTYKSGNIKLYTNAAQTALDTMNVDASLPVYVYNATAGTLTTNTIGAYVPAHSFDTTIPATSSTENDLFYVLSDTNTGEPIAFYVYESV